MDTNLDIPSTARLPSTEDENPLLNASAPVEVTKHREGGATPGAETDKGMEPKVADIASDGEAADEDEGSEAEHKKAVALLREVAAAGKVRFSATKGNRGVKLSDYAHATATHLCHVLGMNRKEVITLALCHYARALTSAPVVTQHDLAMLTKGMQFVVADLTLEVAEMSKLALAVADQESVLGPNVIQ